MSRAVEVEWQFAVRDVDAFERWLVRRRFDDAWSVAGAATVGIRDTYFDTLDWRLRRAGYALRVRRSGERVEATLKALRRARNGVARRREITERLSNARASALRSAPGPVGARLRRLVGTRTLRRLFAVRTRRRTLALRRGTRTVGEIALDRTRIVPPHRRPRRLERLEVEVKAGAPVVVGRFVATLRRQRHLIVARCSKFEAGLAAAGLMPRARR